MSKPSIVICRKKHVYQVKDKNYLDDVKKVAYLQKGLLAMSCAKNFTIEHNCCVTCNQWILTKLTVKTLNVVDIFFSFHHNVFLSYHITTSSTSTVKKPEIKKKNGLLAIL